MYVSFWYHEKIWFLINGYVCYQPEAEHDKHEKYLSILMKYFLFFGCRNIAHKSVSYFTKPLNPWIKIARELKAFFAFSSSKW